MKQKSAFLKNLEDKLKKKPEVQYFDQKKKTQNSERYLINLILSINQVTVESMITAQISCVIKLKYTYDKYTKDYSLSNSMQIPLENPLMEIPMIINQRKDIPMYQQNPFWEEKFPIYFPNALDLEIDDKAQLTIDNDPDNKKIIIVERYGVRITVPVASFSECFPYEQHAITIKVATTDIKGTQNIKLSYLEGESFKTEGLIGKGVQSLGKAKKAYVTEISKFSNWDNKDYEHSRVYFT